MRKVYHVAVQLPLFSTKICPACKPPTEKFIEDFYLGDSVCKVCSNARSLTSYHAHRDKGLSRFKAYYASRRETLNAKSKANYYANIEACRQQKREYAEAHKEEHHANNSAWTKANMKKRCEYMRRRDAKKMAATVGEVNYERILERDGMFCYICEGAILPEHKINFDHVIPLTRGGPHSEDNIKVTHATCNLRKHNRLLEELTPYQRRGIT